MDNNYIMLQHQKERNTEQKKERKSQKDRLTESKKKWPNGKAKDIEAGGNEWKCEGSRMSPVAQRHHNLACHHRT